MKKKLFWWFTTFLFAFACGCRRPMAFVSAVKTVKIDQQLAPSPAIDSIIAPYRKNLEAEMNVTLGIVSTKMELGQPESTLGNWLADALDAQARLHFKNHIIDFSIINYTGIRIPYLPQGNLRLGSFFELMPFENKLAIVQLNGESLRRLVNRMANEGGWLASRQLRYAINTQKQAEHITISNKAINEQNLYTIALSDYLAKGGDGCAFLAKETRFESKLLLRDAFIEAARQSTMHGQNIEAQIDGRVKMLK